MKWQVAWSHDRKSAFIVDTEGFTIVGATLSHKDAMTIVREHNRDIDRLAYNAKFEKTD